MKNIVKLSVVVISLFLGVTFAQANPIGIHYPETFENNGFGIHYPELP